MRLLYADQSGFSWSLPTSYSYSRIGETLCVPRRQGKRLNVIGAWDFVTHELGFELFEGSCTAQRMAEFLERLSLECATRPKQVTLVVLDNASVNTAKEVEARRETWKQRGLHLGYLTPYSPELNLIERLWLAVKYHLLPRRCYESLAALRQALEAVLSSFGAPQPVLTL